MGQAFGAYAEEAEAAIDKRINAAMEGTFKSTGTQAQDSGSEVLLQKIASLTKELAAIKAAGGGTGENGTGENYRPTKPGPKCKYCDRWHPKVAQKDCYKKKGNTAPDWFVARQKKAAAKAAEKAAGGSAGKA